MDKLSKFFHSSVILSLLRVLLIGVLLSSFKIIAGESKDYATGTVVGTFLSGIDSETLQNYDFILGEDFDLSTNYDVDNYSEINFSHSDFSNFVILQSKFGLFGKNRVEVNSIGNRNSVYSIQLGVNNQSFIAQDGNRNLALVSQSGFHSRTSNIAVVIQEGDDNTALVVQKNSGRKSSHISVKQSNNRNLAAIIAGAGSNIGISQSGMGSKLIVNAANSMAISIGQSN